MIPLSASSEAPPPKKNYGQTITLNRSLLLLPTLGATLDISIALCLALLIRFFEELDVLIVTVIIFFESALDFFKFLFNVRDLINVKRAKSIDQWRPVREKKRINHYDPAKEAAKQQWKKAKKAEDKKSEEPKGVHPYWIYSSDEDEA